MKPKSPTKGNLNTVKQEIFEYSKNIIKAEFQKLISMDTDNKLHDAFMDQLCCALTLADLVKFGDEK